jgi:hypothetical protein
MAKTRHEINVNPPRYRVRKGKYWLKSKLDNCTMPEICPDCEHYYECLGEYVRKSHGDDIN